MSGIPEALKPPERAFLERLVAAAVADPDVAALFLGGSHAHGTADAHSDLDLYLVTTEAGFPAFRAGRRAFMLGLGDAVFLEEHEDFGFLMLLFIYADGVCGEMAVAPPQDLGDVHAGPYIVLLDKQGLLDGREFPARRLASDERAELLRGGLVWFWYNRRLLDVALERGHLWTAHYYLERCRQTCLNLARLRVRPEAWPGGYEKADEVLEERAGADLAATVVPLQADALREAATTVTRLYLDLGQALAARHGVAFPHRLASTVAGALDQG